MIVIERLQISLEERPSVPGPKEAVSLFGWFGQALLWIYFGSFREFNSSFLSQKTDFRFFN